MTSLNQDHEDDYQHSQRRTPIGRMDPSSDEDDRYSYEKIIFLFNILYIVMKKENVHIEDQVINLLLKVYESYLS